MTQPDLQTIADPAIQTDSNHQNRSPDAIPASTSPYIADPTTSLDQLNEAIAKLAYAHWEARGRPEGSPEEDWLRAEQELQFMTFAVNAGSVS
jgi:DUF2934 family protein